MYNRTTAAGLLPVRGRLDDVTDDGGGVPAGAARIGNALRGGCLHRLPAGPRQMRPRVPLHPVRPFKVLSSAVRVSVPAADDAPPIHPSAGAPASASSAARRCGNARTGAPNRAGAARGRRRATRHDGSKREASARRRGIRGGGRPARAPAAGPPAYPRLPADK